MFILSKLVGFEAKTFTFEDGKQVSGFNLFFEEKKTGVTGIATDRVFVSSQKLDGYVPVLGDELTVNYNRWGKVQSISSAPTRY